MRDVDDDICGSLERLTDPIGRTPPADVLWSDLVVRRRRRRARNGASAALALLLVTLLGAGLLAAQGPDTGPADVAAGDGDAAASDEARAGGPDLGVDSYEELQEHLAPLSEDVPRALLPEVVVPVRPPDGWTLVTASASSPSDGSSGSIGFDYVDMSSTGQPLPAVYVGTTTLPEPEACTPTDETLERERVAVGSGYVACIVGSPGSVAEWTDVEWTTIPRFEHG